MSSRYIKIYIATVVEHKKTGNYFCFANFVNKPMLNKYSPRKRLWKKMFMNTCDEKLHKKVQSNRVYAFNYKRGSIKS